MAAAWSYWPARSSSKPWPIACARSGRTTSTERISPSIPRLKAGPNTTLPLRAMLCRAHSSEREGSLLLRRIQSPEILEHQPTLLGGETLELLPPGVPEPRARARRARLQYVGDVHAVSGRGPADAFFVLVGLVVRERAAGVQQSAVQALLALDGLLVEAPSLELTCELLRLLRERTGGGVRAFGLEPLELLRPGPLPPAATGWRRPLRRAAARRRRAPVPARARPSPRAPGRAPPTSHRATPAPASRADRAAHPARPRAAARPPSRLPPRPPRDRRPPLARRAASPLPPRGRPAAAPRAGCGGPPGGPWRPARCRGPRSPRGRRACVAAPRRRCPAAPRPRDSTRPDVAAGPRRRPRATPARPRRRPGGTAPDCARAGP